MNSNLFKPTPLPMILKRIFYLGYWVPCRSFHAEHSALNLFLKNKKHASNLLVSEKLSLSLSLSLSLCSLSLSLKSLTLAFLLLLSPIVEIIQWFQPVQPITHATGFDWNFRLAVGPYSVHSIQLDRMRVNSKPDPIRLMDSLSLSVCCKWLRSTTVTHSKVNTLGLNGLIYNPSLQRSLTCHNQNSREARFDRKWRKIQECGILLQLLSIVFARKQKYSKGT